MATQDHMTDICCARDTRRDANICFNDYFFFPSGIFYYYLEDKRPF